MADNIDVKMLRDAINMMSKAMGGNGISSSGNQSSAYASYKNNDPKDPLDKLKNSMANNSKYFDRLALHYKNLSKKGKLLENLYDELNKNTNNLNKVQRKAAIAIADVLSQAKGAKETYSKLKKMSRTVENADQALENSTKILKELDDANRKRKDIVKKSEAAEKEFQKKIQQASDELDKAKKGNASPEKIKELSKKLYNVNYSSNRSKKHYDQNLKKTDDIIKKTNKEYDEQLEHIKKLNDLTGALSDSELEMLKNIKDLNSDRKGLPSILAKTKDAINSASSAINIAANRVNTNFTKGLDKGTTGLKKFAEWLVKLPTYLVQDMMARDKYNVESADTFTSMSRGMSEAERARLTAENRLQFRSMGNGNEEQGFFSSKALQNSAHMFGVYGAEALQKALQYQKVTGGMGISYSNVGATKLQMSFMRDFAKQIGVTDDQMQDYYTSLKQMGEIDSIRSTMAGKSEKEQQKAINQEIYNRTKLNAALGVSIDLQKQMQQQAINQRYAGIKQLIMSKISSGIQMSMYNQRNPNNQISSKDMAFVSSIDQAGGLQTIQNDADRKRYLDIKKKVNMSDLQTLKAGQNQAAKGNPSLMFRNAIQSQILGETGMNRQQENLTYSAIDAQAKAQGKKAIDQTKSFSTTLKEATASMDGPNGFKEAIYRATEALHGFNNSALGGGTRGAGSMIENAVIYKGVDKLIDWGIGKIAKRYGLGGAAEAAEGAIGRSGIGGMLSSAKNGAWDLVKGGAKKIGFKGLGLGIAGGLSAYGINKLFGGSDTISKGNDDIGSKGLRGADQLANFAMGSGYIPAMGVGLAVKGGLRIGNAANKAIEHSNTLSDIRDMVFGTVFGGTQALFGGDKAGWNLAKRSTADLFGLTPSNKVNVPKPIAAPQTNATVVNNHLYQQAMDAMQQGDTEDAIKYLKEIAKSNKEMNDRDNKTEQQKQIENQQKMGSGYEEYNKHIQETLTRFKA